MPSSNWTWTNPPSKTSARFRQKANGERSESLLPNSVSTAPARANEDILLYFKIYLSYIIIINAHQKTKSITKRRSKSYKARPKTVKFTSFKRRSHSYKHKHHYRRRHRFHKALSIMPHMRYSHEKIQYSVNVNCWSDSHIGNRVNRTFTFSLQ